MVPKWGESFRKEDGQQSQMLQREGVKGIHWIFVAKDIGDHSKNIMNKVIVAEAIL